MAESGRKKSKNWISWHIVSVNADVAHACRRRSYSKSTENCFQSMLNQIQTTIPLLPIVLQSKRFVLAYSKRSNGYKFFFADGNHADTLFGLIRDGFLFAV